MLMACDCMQACTFCEMRSITSQFVVVCLTCRFSVYYLRIKSDFLLSVWKIHPKEVLFRDQIRCAQWRGMIHNPWICQNPPFPPSIPGHLTGFLLLKVGNLTLPGLPGLLGLAFDFLVKTLFSISSERSHYSFIQHVHCVHGSLLLYYSFLSWSIWEPLKKPVKCGLSGIDKWVIWPKMRHSRSGIWLLSQNADQHHNRKDLGGGLFYHFNCQLIYWEIWPKVFKKVKCPGVCGARWGEGGGGGREAWAVKYWNWVVHAFLSSMVSETTSRQ